MADGTGEPLPLTVRETLDSVMAPAVRDAVLRSALREAGHRDVPTQPDRFRDFLDGPLRRALVQAVGLELGESIVDELGLLVARAGVPASSSKMRAADPIPPIVLHRRSTRPSPIPHWAPQEKRSSERSITSLTDPSAEPELGTRITPAPSERSALGRITAPQPIEPARTERTRTNPGVPPPSSASYPRGTAETLGVGGVPGQKLPFVLLASQDARLVQQLSSWLDPKAAVVRVRGVLPLLHHIEDAGGSPLVIILDCQKPSVQPRALAALADELPADTRVVMWGASTEVEEQVVSLSERARSWFVCSAHAEAKDIAERCAQLLA